MCNARTGCQPVPCCAQQHAARLGGGGRESYNHTAYLLAQLPEPPTLLLFYHIEKTGGTAVMAWMVRNVQRKTPRLDAAVPYSETTTFMCSQFGAVLGGACVPARPRRPAPTGRDRERLAPTPEPKFPLTICNRHGAAPLLGSDAWKRARVAVEFHTPGVQAFYIGSVEPALPQLRELYRAVGGRVVTATLVREPVSHVFSAWYMWPPVQSNEPSATRLPVENFTAWAESVEAAQAGLLVLEKPGVMHTRFGPMRRGMHSSDTTQGKRCSILPDARARLARFDLVGVTSCLPSLLRAVEARLGLQPALCTARQRYRLAANGSLACVQDLARPKRRAGGGLGNDRLLDYSPHNVPSAIHAGDAVYAPVHAWRWAALRPLERARLLELT